MAKMKRPIRPFGVCEMCQSPLVMRQNNKEGNYFLGCSEYGQSNCPFTCDLTQAEIGIMLRIEELEEYCKELVAENRDLRRAQRGRTEIQQWHEPRPDPQPITSSTCTCGQLEKVSALTNGTAGHA